MVCLVTGSSRGLGKAIALAFGKKGHKVAIHYKNKRKEAEIVALQLKGSVVLYSDITDFNETRALVDNVIQKWGRIDVLVNNAGIAKEALLLKTSEKDFDDIINTNLKGPFNFIRATAPFMVKQKSGHIINISSIAGVKGKSGLSAYSASKAGLIGLTLSTAIELSRHNIMVNAILPGFMLTDMGLAADVHAKKAALKDSLLEKHSDPENVAEFVMYLSGTKGITGQVFNLDSRII